jgi:hypothetical protein
LINDRHWPRLSCTKPEFVTVTTGTTCDIIWMLTATSGTIIIDVIYRVLVEGLLPVGRAGSRSRAAEPMANTSQSSRGIDRCPESRRL